RLFGPTVMEKFIDWGRADGFSHFFLVSSEGTLSKLRESITAKFPGAKIAGMISPPFGPATQWDNDRFIQVINEAQPDFIWVGLGAPKQEIWMYDQHQKLQHGIMFGIGAGFDYLAGNTKHAPAWMKNASLEWLYRLFQEPKRLWRRYLSTIPRFILLASLELLGFDVVSRRKTNHALPNST
ncbi:MAG TPA: WecB/TagA/CpsF family glycosyltransferase, partial [Chitinophagaceae bacterium]|nr:WecB/TagA/CpsF family glycosyltransferase [Chitinophagaceae bacterium]